MADDTLQIEDLIPTDGVPDFRLRRWRRVLAAYIEQPCWTKEAAAGLVEELAQDGVETCARTLWRDRARIKQWIKDQHGRTQDPERMAALSLGVIARQEAIVEGAMRDREWGDASRANLGLASLLGVGEDAAEPVRVIIEAADDC